MDKNILLVPSVNKERKNVILVKNTWDQDDGDYTTEEFELDPEEFFSNDKLIYLLAYITTPYNGDEPKFGCHVDENMDIDDIIYTLDNEGFIIRTYQTDYEPCHSVVKIKMTYYDENGDKSDISFENVRKSWQNKSYDEIVEFINSL
jgi:hypothetical protein